MRKKEDKYDFKAFGLAIKLRTRGSTPVYRCFMTLYLY